MIVEELLLVLDLKPLFIFFKEKCRGFCFKMKKKSVLFF